jgi:hypothetical protein
MFPEQNGDLLVGAEAIRDYLVELGLPATTKAGDVYYLKRAQQWPIGKVSEGRSAKLIASKRRLMRHAEKLTAV